MDKELKRDGFAVQEGELIDYWVVCSDAAVDEIEVPGVAWVIGVCEMVGREVRRGSWSANAYVG